MTTARIAHTLVLRIHPRLLRTLAQTLRLTQMRTQPKNRPSSVPVQTTAATLSTQVASQNPTVSEVARYGCLFSALSAPSVLRKTVQRSATQRANATFDQKSLAAILPPYDFRSPLSPLQSALPEITLLTPLESALTRKSGEGNVMSTCGFLLNPNQLLHTAVYPWKAS